ncbi:hypothetical protein [Mycobacterium sp.]|uniref:hypothetical protein n=1 Tax=Mycobacterium sp. TaxID=1785 RepID=UPI0025E3284E|nr:hypothetical protein [Mycobacterium sp.]
MSAEGPSEESFRASRMTRAVKQRSDLGDLTKIGQGGQGVVYRAPGVRTQFSASLVFKQYRSEERDRIDFQALASMPALVEKSLSYADGERLISLAAWPCEIVEDQGVSIGFLMPEIPHQFFISLSTMKGTSRNRAEFQHLLNDQSVLRARGIQIDDVQRYRLLREVASGLAFLHDHGVTVGDISPNNLLFSLVPGSNVYFIDCDSMCVDGHSALAQVETPGWEAPAGEKLSTVYSDAYKLGLLALRLLAGDQDVRNPDHLPANTPDMVRRVIADTLRAEPRKRPLAEVWTYQLGYAIEEAQHRKASEPAQPPASPLAAQPPPDVKSVAPPPSTPTAPTPGPSSTDPAPSNKKFAIATAAAIAVVLIILIFIVSVNGSSHPDSVASSDSSTVTPTNSTTDSASTGAADVPSASITDPPAPSAPSTHSQSTAEPYWDGPWLRNYWEGSQDCNLAGLDYWVVQPGSDAGMYALKLACFPTNWTNLINKHCKQFNLPKGRCAVWDQDSIMSSFEKHGDLLIVALTQACLDRANLTDFHEGPLHQDCVVRAE